MLMKAHRFQTGLEVFRPTEYIRKTIYSEGVPPRTKDIPPGQEDHFVSVWGQLTSSETKMKLWDIELDGDKSHDRADQAPPEWKYTDADRLEDAVLFPWDKPSLSSESADPTAETEPGLTHGETHNRNMAPDIARFVYDLDTDEELSDIDSDGLRESDESSIEDEVTEEGSDSSSESALQPEEKKEVFEAIADWHQISGQGPEGSFFRSKMEEMPTVVEDFRVFLDRNRATYFKRIWHNSDMEPGAGDRWTEYQHLVTAYRQWRDPEDAVKKTVSTKSLANVFRTLAHLGHGKDTHHRVVRDMRQSDLLVSLFFDQDPSFLSSEDAASFRDSLLLNQQARSAQFPDIRSHHSNKTRPAEYWQEWDDLHTISEPNGQIITHADCPTRWSLTLQPTIARLYKEGVICPAYSVAASGPAVCLTEPNREEKPDLYFDWRHAIKKVHLPRELHDPTRVKPLVEQALDIISNKKFLRPEKARFTVLKIWSAPHFWPLMLGVDNRENTSFVDLTGRIWEWMCIPKDMPASEWIIHHIFRMRITPYEDAYFHGKVLLRRDVVLVVGENEKECRELTTAAVFAIQTRPWRLEVDPWKSWWNVDLPFLEGLNGRWWE